MFGVRWVKQVGRIFKAAQLICRTVPRNQLRSVPLPGGIFPIKIKRNEEAERIAHVQRGDCEQVLIQHRRGGFGPNSALSYSCSEKFYNLLKHNKNIPITKFRLVESRLYGNFLPYMLGEKTLYEGDSTISNNELIVFFKSVMQGGEKERVVGFFVACVYQELGLPGVKFETEFGTDTSVVRGISAHEMKWRERESKAKNKEHQSKLHEKQGVLKVVSWGNR